MKIFNKSLCFSLVLLSSFILIAQVQHTPSTERGDVTKRAKGQMEGNEIRASIFNWTQTGREGGTFPINVQTPYEWPKNTGKVYLAMTGLFVGGEVNDQNNNLIKIVNVFNYRQSQQGRTWNFEPVPGYYSSNVQEIANSENTATWPEFWPDKMNVESDPGWRGKWNGYFGKDIKNADMEMFYKCSDDLYDRHAYIPDTTDPTRKGLGLLIDVRALAWSQVLVEDAIYLLHNIKNDGTKDINKVGVTIWYADFVGGDGDSQDDISEFDLIEDIAWSRDRDNRATTFGADPVGIIAVSFLETPGNALDRVDNDGDGEEFGPIVSEALIQNEISDNQVDDNGNGLIDENQTHIVFGTQTGVTYADGIDQNGDAESGSPVVTSDMVSLVEADQWKRWPRNPGQDPVQLGRVHLLMVEAEDVGRAFQDYIDNDGDGEASSPVITQEMIDAAALDAPYFRYSVPGTNVILYNVMAEDLGMMFADGIDNDGNGAVDEFIDEGIDEMIDEARNNGIDDDGDWNVLTDDVGLDGVEDTGDDGENDGKPTSGAGTGLPGEPNIDVTDVSETDQIGITNAQYIPAGDLNVNTSNDAVLWFRFMRPGFFYDPLIVQAGEYDLMVSSSYFPLKAGQVEPISLAVVLANGPATDPDGEFRKREVLKKRVRAQETYNNDYQFANAPITPIVTAIPGDNRVTLYWDDEAESSFDNYINNIGGNGNDFEGYRIYRASDPAFEDPELVTTGYGIKKFKLPMKIFDLVDGIKGFDSVGIDGVHFDLGEDSGLQHSWVDTTVQNGFTYYYAVTSYDFGFPSGNIIPSESPIRISIQGDGSVSLGPNVAKVTPEAPAAGYVAPTLGTVDLVQGSTTGKINYEIIDINKIKNEHVYYLTFKDTLIVGTGGKPDTLKTKSYTLMDSTENVVLIEDGTKLSTLDEQPIVDGFKLNFVNETRVEYDRDRSKWADSAKIPPMIFEKFVSSVGKGQENLSDYEIIFGEVGIDTSLEFKYSSTNTFPPKPVNFKVLNRSTNNFIEFGFMELDDSLGGPGKFSRGKAVQRVDRIIFLEKNAADSLVKTWWVYLSRYPDSLNSERIPQAGDTAFIFLKKPFLSSDVFRFVAKAGKIDNDLAKQNLDNVKVVPNPYVATALWEPKNPYSSGRGPRSLHFTHLPAKCTIRIFTVSGELVDVIEHDNQYNDGTAEWDMLSKDNLSISYGVYVYHVDAPGIGEKIGKFAVIK